MKKLFLDSKLTTLNEYIILERSNKFAGASVKKKTEKNLSCLIKEQQFKLEKSKQYYIIIEWYNYRQDPDNVEFCQKFIFDSLQKSGVLENDNDKFILHKIHFHKKDKLTSSQYQIVYFFDEKTEFINYFLEHI